ncbi:MAG: hypothetical protein H6562_07750 [Lewinellaceae bacterium]|nr:hypothetical protein [Lewinella sp.]MCB9278790.1 hypothetical protein [Lewinellaceae bacterium]
MSNTWRSLLVLVFTGLGAIALQAQNENATIKPKSNSPYSRFGLGDVLPGYLAGSAGMGGLTAAYNDFYHLNLANPAALAHLKATSFEVGLYGKYTKLATPSGKDDVWGGNLSYLALGFPLKNPVNRALDRNRSPWDFGMSLSLAPYTRVGYSIESKTYNDGFKEATNYLKGDGGIYRAQWGNSVKYKNLSLGLNLEYNFGKAVYSRRVAFDSLSHSYETEYRNEIAINGLSYTLGAQYVYNFKKPNAKGEMENTGKRIIVGAYGRPAQNLNSESSRFFQRNNISSYVGVVIDTFLLESGVKNAVDMPMEWTIGISYEQINKLRVGLEYSSGKWSKFANPAKPEQLTDSYRFAAGVEYVPNLTSYNSYTQKIYYRAGFYQAGDPRTVNGQQLKQTAVTLGFGFPIIMPRQQVSFVDLSLEAGKFGVKDVLTESFIKLNLGFTLNDNSWFFKRKFN